MNRCTEISSNVSFDRDKLKSAIHTKAIEVISSLNADSTIPRKTVQSVVNLYNEIGSMTTSANNYIFHRLQHLGESQENMNNITDVLKVVQSPFENLSSEYLRFKMLEKVGVFFPPIEQVIGSKNQTKLSPNGNVTERHIDIKAQLIPLRKVLKAIFESKNVFKNVIEYKKRLLNEKEVFSNFI